MRFEQNWKARVPDGENKSEFFPAAVPGNVQRDYAEFKGILNDLQFSVNVKRLEETEGFFWEYKTNLNYSLGKGERLFFVAEGIDYIYDIFLEDRKLFSGEGMYTPVETDITDIAKPGDTLTVLIHPHPKKQCDFPGTRVEASESCKPPVCYGWDWNPRLLVSGFWRSAYLETRSDASIGNVEVKYELDIERLFAKLHFDIDCKAPVTITVADPSGRVVYRGSDKEPELTDIKLWWCSGQGEPNLYSYSVESGSEVKTGKIGFRTVSLVMNVGTKNEPLDFPKGPCPMPATVCLNGRRIFSKGSNYVNPELFPANTSAETNEFLVKSAKEANMNILRIWGGAGLAKPELYDLCDEHGILVWQEFPLACNNYEGSEHYLSVLEKEAASIIRELRGHPCIALFCGGNELLNGWSGMTDQSLPIRLLNLLCYTLCREIPFILSSPRGGMAHGGYTFSDDCGKEVFEIFQSSTATAYTEFGVPAITETARLKKIIPENELSPITATDSWICHHGFGAWGDERWLCLDVLESYFGKIDSLEDAVTYSNWLQTEGYKAAFEESRRQWPHCSMAINWCFNEPWITAAGNSIIGYPNVKKPSYYAVQSSLRPTLATARIPKFSWQNGELLSFEIWYHNDTPLKTEDAVTAAVEIGGEKTELLEWKTGEINANSCKIGPTVNFVLPACREVEYIKIHLTTESGRADNCYKLLYRCSEKDNALRGLNE